MQDVLRFRRRAPDLTDKYRITQQSISRGTYSDVSKGVLTRDDGSKIEIAIKTLRHVGQTASTESSFNHPKLLKKLLYEVNIWRPLKHPNIAPFLGVSTPHDEPPSLISPWFANGSLTSYLQDFPQANRLHILCDLSDGLAYLHSMKIVHGDIKPDNVLVDSDGRVYWGDFGIAHFVEGAAESTGQTSASTFACGTPRYYSPEQVLSEYDGQRKTTMMDIWGFGCLIAQVMSGEKLYANCRTDVAVCREIFRGNLPMDTFAQAILNPQQRPIWDIVDMCWRTEPDTRPTASEIWEKIGKLLDSSRIFVQLPRYHLTNPGIFSSGIASYGIVGFFVVVHND
ncbi:hypothetical protein FRC03_003703 [Tulasnella sp. 419]|nr:hypothetical protein FRC03_003703 [Tulasnella sp. 419]